MNSVWCVIFSTDKYSNVVRIFSTRRKAENWTKKNTHTQYIISEWELDPKE